MDWLFELKDYKEVIQEQIKRSGSPRGYRSSLAEAAQCQPAYITHVLNSKVHLTPDHAASLADFWGFNESESTYFITLVHLGRAGTENLKKKLLKQLKETRENHLARANNFHQAGLDEHQKAIVYYSHWTFSCIHILLTIESLRTEEALSKHLGISKQEIKITLEGLQEIGLVIFQNNKWIPTLKSLHTGTADLMSFSHHKNWRIKAVDSIGKKNEKNLHYTAVHSLSQADFALIRNKLRAEIENVRKVIDPSKEEVGACIVIDWFGV